nr:MAG TPA: hypothetical protein [Caudoviricetes sp.]
MVGKGGRGLWLTWVTMFRRSLGRIVCRRLASLGPPLS